MSGVSVIGIEIVLYSDYVCNNGNLLDLIKNKLVDIMSYFLGNDEKVTDQAEIKCWTV